MSSHTFGYQLRIKWAELTMVQQMNQFVDLLVYQFINLISTIPVKILNHDVILVISNRAVMDNIIVIAILENISNAGCPNLQLDPHDLHPNHLNNPAWTHYPMLTLISFRGHASINFIIHRVVCWQVMPVLVK